MRDLGKISSDNLYRIEKLFFLDIRCALSRCDEIDATRRTGNY